MRNLPAGATVVMDVKKPRGAQESCPRRRQVSKGGV
jgi:hypothetical protein